MILQLMPQCIACPSTKSLPSPNCSYTPQIITSHTPPNTTDIPLSAMLHHPPKTGASFPLEEFCCAATAEPVAYIAAHEL